MSVQDLIKQVAEGKSVHDVVTTAISEQVVKESVGPDRRDLSPDEVADKFAEIIQRVAQSFPYVDMDWAAHIEADLRAGHDPAALAQMAQVNRDQYAAAGFKIDAGGDADSWRMHARCELGRDLDLTPAGLGFP